MDIRNAYKKYLNEPAAAIPSQNPCADVNFRTTRWNISLWIKYATGVHIKG
jgi:hypothetical protein